MGVIQNSINQTMTIAGGLATLAAGEDNKLKNQLIAKQQSGEIDKIKNKLSTLYDEKTGTYTNPELAQKYLDMINERVDIVGARDPLGKVHGNKGYSTNIERAMANKAAIHSEKKAIDTQQENKAAQSMYNEPKVESWETQPLAQAQKEIDIKYDQKEKFRQRKEMIRNIHGKKYVLTPMEDKKNG